MTDYKNLTVRELDEAVSLGALDLVYLLVEAGINRDKFRESLDKLNAATAELVFRADNYPDPTPEISRLTGALLATQQELLTIAGGIDTVLNNRGGEETSDQ
jgi:hypothetical protein